MLEIWGRRDSSNVQALMWCVGELGLRYTRHDVGHRFGGTDTDAFGVMNPNRTVPVIRDKGGPALWETGAILRYLATQYGSEDFWPSDACLRADVDRWAEWAKINVALGFTAPVFWRVVRTAKAQQDQDAIGRAVALLEAFLAIADERLSKHAFLVGDTLTLSDIQFGHVLYRYFDIAIERRDLAALRSYYDRLCLRPAYREHVMVSYDGLKVD